MQVVGSNYSDTDDQLAVVLKLTTGEFPMYCTLWMELSGTQFHFSFTREPETPYNTAEIARKVLNALWDESKDTDEIPYVDAAKRLAAQKFDFTVPRLRHFDELKDTIDGMLVNEGYENTFTALRDVVASHTADQDETIRNAIVPVIEQIVAILPEED